MSKILRDTSQYYVEFLLKILEVSLSDSCVKKISLLQAQYLYSGSRDGYIRSFDFRAFKVASAVRGKKSVDNVKILSNQTHLIVSTMAGHVRFFIYPII